MNRKPPAKPGHLPASQERAELELLRERATERVFKDPIKAATILADWIKKPAGRKKAA